MRIRPLISAAAVVAVFAAPAAASADRAPKKPCAMKGSTTVAKNRTARVFKRDSRVEGEEERLYSCLFRENRRRVLATSTNDDSGYSDFGAVTLNGRYVAWKSSSYYVDDSCRADCPSSGGSSSSDLVNVKNLATRKGGTYDGEPTGKALVVTAAGNVAWIQGGDVYAGDAAGKRTLYDGDNADPKSLRLQGSTVSWTAGGQAMTAELQPQARVAAAGATRCSAKGSRTVVKNRFARVFTTKGDPNVDEVRRLYACLYSNGRRWRIDTATDDEYVSASAFNAVRLNGRYVAWQHTSYDGSCKADCPPGYEQTQTQLRVANLRKRRIKRVAGSLGEGTALVVTTTGAIAWIQPGGPVSVRAHDADGARVLYQGDDIDGGSLSLSGSTVAWVAGGTPMSATLR